MADHFGAFLKKNKTYAACVCFSVVWGLLATLLIFLFPSPFENLNFKIYDWQLAIDPVRSYSSAIVHVDIDDRAVKEYGQWPWDRSLSAKIVEKLSEFGAGAIAFDIFYSAAGKSKEGNDAFFGAIKRAGNVVSATGLGRLTDISDKSIELPRDRSKADALYDKGWSLAVPGTFHLLRVYKLQDSALPLLPIIQTSSGVGHIAANPDRDGVYRRVALLVRVEDRCIPSLSLSTLMTYWKLTADHIVLDDKSAIEIKRGSRVARIPVDASRNVVSSLGKTVD